MFSVGRPGQGQSSFKLAITTGQAVEKLMEAVFVQTWIQIHSKNIHPKHDSRVPYLFAEIMYFLEAGKMSPTPALYAGAELRLTRAPLK